MVKKPVCPPDLTARPFSLTIEHTMRATSIVLYQAWTTSFDRWFATPGTLIIQGKIKVNTLFFWEVQHEGNRYPHYGRFLRLKQDQLVELTWLTGVGGTNGAETVVKVELTPVGTGTNLRLTHAGFLGQESRDQHEKAWPMVLTHLDACMAETS